jgi:uncharacterized protein YbbC (DUF1343 family)
MQFGLDRLLADSKLLNELRSSRVGLLAIPASVTRNLVHALDALQAAGVRPAMLFGPEHGWAGHAQDMIGVDHAQGIVSLYGDSYDDLTPKREHLDPIDVIVIDIQDVGSRYYTFQWTAVLVARACRDFGKRVIFLDRPNPIGCVAVEGKLQEAPLRSFVGLEPTPIRHALTAGEVLAWRAKKEGYSEIVRIIPVEGLDRAAHATAWDRPFVMPSPNMPTYETALVYPGGCLLEGTNLSDGRGTTRPFELTGAPWLDGNKLARDLMALGLPGFVARPTSFLPTFHKHGSQLCGGVQIHPTDPATFRPVATYLALITLSHHAHPEHFKFRTEKYEFRDDVPAFDLLIGSSRARERILANDDVRAIVEDFTIPGREESAIVAEARAAIAS